MSFVPPAACGTTNTTVRVGKPVASWPWARAKPGANPAVAAVNPTTTAATTALLFNVDTATAAEITAATVIDIAAKPADDPSPLPHTRTGIRSPLSYLIGSPQSTSHAIDAARASRAHQYTGTHCLHHSCLSLEITGAGFAGEPARRTGDFSERGRC